MHTLMVQASKANGDEDAAARKRYKRIVFIVLGLLAIIGGVVGAIHAQPDMAGIHCYCSGESREFISGKCRRVKCVIMNGVCEEVWEYC